jgi:hypothetical protein
MHKSECFYPLPHEISRVEKLDNRQPEVDEEIYL